MLKKFLLIIFASTTLSGCSLSPKRAGIEVMSYPTAKVFHNGKEMGMTPYKNSSLQPGEAEIRLKTNEAEWVRKIELKNNANTVIDWELGKKDNESGGYILSMEKTGDSKKAGLIVNVTPDKSTISIDNEIKGFSPLRIDDIGEGDKQVSISFPGHKTIIVYVKATKGYQLIIESKLTDETPVISLNENNEDQESTLVQLPQTKTVTIKDTETGWLRVREDNNSAAAEIAKIKPGEKFKLLEESGDWYKVDLGENKKGWISSKYADKSE